MMWWQWPDVSGAALSRLTVLAPWIWNIFCSYHLFLVRTGPGLNWCVAVPPWLVCNFYDPHGNGGSAVGVERPAHTLLVEWLGFQDRYSHIKAQLRAEAVVSKGGSNVWVVRYLLLCLGRKSLLNRIFQCRDYPSWGSVKALPWVLVKGSPISVGSCWIHSISQEEIPHSGDGAAQTPLGPPHPTSNTETEPSVMQSLLGTGSLAFLPSLFCSTWGWSWPLSFTWEWLTCHFSPGWALNTITPLVHSFLPVHTDRKKNSDINWCIQS